MKKYFKILLVALLMYGVGVILCFSFDVFPPMINWFFIAFFALYSILSLYLLNRSMILKPQVFINRFLLLSGIKLIGGLMILTLVLFLISDYKILTGMVFLFSFLVFLIVEVITILGQLKKNRIKKVK